MALTDGNGAVTDQFQYSEYGQILNHTGSSDTPFAWQGEWGVMSDRGMNANGLYYLRTRYYHPALLRFIQQDSYLGDITDPTSLNRYAYCNGDPVNYIDPTGMMATDYDAAQNDADWLRKLISSGAYVDINGSIGYWGGITGGVMINNTGLYPYFGGGLVSPGWGITVTGSPYSPTHGWNAGLQGQFGIAGQIGYGFGKGGGWFGEIGAGYPPGVSLTGYYVWGPFFSPQQPQQGKQNK